MIAWLYRLIFDQLAQLMHFFPLTAPLSSPPPSLYIAAPLGALHLLPSVAATIQPAGFIPLVLMSHFECPGNARQVFWQLWTHEWKAGYTGTLLAKRKANIQNVLGVPAWSRTFLFEILVWSCLVMPKIRMGFHDYNFEHCQLGKRL